MILFEFLIPRRPVSLQTRNRQNLQGWKTYVRSEAARTWTVPASITTSDLQLTLVYLYDSDPVDIDNIRRSLRGTFKLTRLPHLLFDGVVRQQECVYVRVRDATKIEDYV